MTPNKRPKKSQTAQDETVNAQSTASARPRRVRGRRGGLEKFSEMPLDVLFEIFGHLEPLDLLHLARTTKALRAFLMNRDSATFWRTARANVHGLPDCPHWLSEPKYAALAFDHHCHGCFAPNVQIIRWGFRARFCYECFTARTTRLSRATVELMNYLFTEFGMCNTRGLLVLTSDLEELEASWEATRTAEEKEAVNARWRQTKEEMHSHIVLCERWLEQRKSDRSEELKAIRQSRFESILQRLRDVGWGATLEHMKIYNYSALRQLSSVSQPRELTSRSWQKIKNEIMAVMERHLKAEREKVFLNRLNVVQAVYRRHRRSYGAVFPSLHDFALASEVRVIMEAPSNVVVDADSFINLESNVSGIVTKWKAEETFKMVEFALEGVDVAQDLDPATLAVFSLFQCDSCRKPELWKFPELLIHSCRSMPLHTPEPHGWYEELVDEYWGQGSSKYSGAFKAVKASEQVVKACGQDPSTVTISQMDALNLRLSCKTCCRHQIREVMTWQAAVEHVYWRGSLLSAKCCLERVPTEEAAQCVELEKVANRLCMEELEDEGWCCVHCEPSSERKLHVSKMNIIKHLRNMHNIPDSVENDLFRHPDAGVVIPKTVHLVSNKLEEHDIPSHIRGQLARGDAVRYEFPSGTWTSTRV